MKTILVDDEILTLEHFAEQCEGIDGIELVGKFNFPVDALEYAKEHAVDLMISDINMPEMTGLELGEKMKEINPDILIIYVTGYGEYAQEAMALRAVTYIMKPYTKDDIEFSINRARKLFKGNQKNVFIKTFGRFDIFAEGRPVLFKNAKAKELLALCVEHRGGILTMDEAVDKLWEDKPYNDATKALYRKAVMTLKNTLQEINCEDLIEKNRGNIFIYTEKVNCDYFKLMEGDAEAIADYNGTFMEEYSWADLTNVNIKKKLKKIVF